MQVQMLVQARMSEEEKKNPLSNMPMLLRSRESCVLERKGGREG